MLVGMVLIAQQFSPVEVVTIPTPLETMLLMHSIHFIRRIRFQVAAILEELLLVPALTPVSIFIIVPYILHSYTYTTRPSLCLFVNWISLL